MNHHFLRDCLIRFVRLVVLSFFAVPGLVRAADLGAVRELVNPDGWANPVEERIVKDVKWASSGTPPVESAVVPLESDGVGYTVPNIVLYPNRVVKYQLIKIVIASAAAFRIRDKIFLYKFSIYAVSGGNELGIPTQAVIPMYLMDDDGDGKFERLSFHEPPRTNDEVSPLPGWYKHESPRQ